MKDVEILIKSTTCK